MDPSYLAGVMDSDGSISIAKKLNHNGKKGMRNYRLIIQITWLKTQESLQVLNEIKKNYNGSVYITKSSSFSPNNSYYKYFIDNRKAVKILTDILPFLRIKKKQAVLGLKLAKIKEKRKFNKYHPHTRADWKIEDNLQKQIMKLNRKGKKNVIHI